LRTDQNNVTLRHVDFGEFFTQRARELAPLAWRRDLLFLFDFRGPLVEVEAEAGRLGTALRRLSDAALELLHGGFIFMAAQTELHENGTAELSISLAGTGTRANDARVSQVLQRLGLSERAPDAAVREEGARVAMGVCSSTGGRVSFAANRSDGLLFGLDLTLRASPMETYPPPNAEGARAWLISDMPRVHQSLLRSLQRLGWATTAFTSAEEAAAQLARMTAWMARPALVIAAESGSITLDGLQPVRRQLPATTNVIFATSIESKTQVRRPDIELRRWPLSPGELREFTRRLGGVQDTVSGLTTPVPVAFADRPHALVVDDNPVNLLVATGLLENAGFEVHTAAGGQEALTRCRERSPALVLMDVDMPGMNGLDTTRLMRRLQREGVLPKFAILAATAEGMDISERECLAAGMDGYLCKPLKLEAIQQEVRRVLPAFVPRHAS
jgi:CheY-like chemotaxis protein